MAKSEPRTFRSGNEVFRVFIPSYVPPPPPQITRRRIGVVKAHDTELAKRLVAALRETLDESEHL